MSTPDGFSVIAELLFAMILKGTFLENLLNYLMKKRQGFHSILVSTYPEINWLLLLTDHLVCLN